MRGFCFTITILLFSFLATAQVAPPPDAEWTLYLQTIAGPDHVAQAKVQKDLAIKATGMKDFYIIHGDGDSKLYYGYYKAIETNVNKRAAEQAQADRKKLQTFQDASGARPFGLCMFVEIATPDPDGPPQWNLANTGKYFSLQIAAYKDSPLRKQYAVDAVREARKQGIEAYYYHGDTTSSVCIGAWPRSAVKEQEADSGGSNNPDDLIAVSNAPLSPEMLRRIQQSAPNKHIKAFEPKFEPIDPTLIKAMKDYPTHAINGEVYSQKMKDVNTGAIVDVPDPSFIIMIPQKQAYSFTSATTAEQPQPAPALAQPAAPSGTGRLKSLDQ